MKKIYAKVLEKEALKQFEDSCAHPDFVQGALMADAHFGYSLPIGGVIGLKHTIVPGWVGSDIGCGMCAIKTSLKKDDLIGYKKNIFEALYHHIPMGEGKCNVEPIRHKVNFKGTKLPQIARRESYYQLGTLGGGNHFIEISYDEQDRVCIVIHSGSRGIGWKIADAYMAFDPKNKGFDINSPIGKQYIADMNFCLKYALANRKSMLDKAWHALREVLKTRIEFDWDNMINRNHNHAEAAHGMIIHRKGATHAEYGMLGVIPGNMRDGSFIVEGLGNPDALWSSSHGAGRVLSRKKAKKKIKLKDFEESMVDIVGKVEESTLDESPFAYKNIFDVIHIQEEAGLIKVIHHLKPLINCKG